MARKSAVKSRERAARGSADPTRARILEAAERLFALRGLHGVAIRDIAREAEVDPALVHYHFGTKNELFSVALLSRAEGFMLEREAALEACIKQANGKPTLEDVIIAYTKPYLEHAESGEEGWRSWFKLLAHSSLSLEWAPEVWQEHFDPFVQKFIDAMKLAAPGAPEGHYYWCYHFFSGGLIMTFANTGRMDHLSDGDCKSDDLANGYDLLVPFFADAFEAILSGRRGPLPDKIKRAIAKPSKSASKSRKSKRETSK